MKSFFSPPAITEGLVSSGIKKAARSTEKLLLLGFMAGCYIAFAAHLATVVSTGWTVGGESVFYGLKKFLSGAVFSVGLMLVLIPGAELFTGNCLMPVALLEGRITFRSMLRNWVLVWTANLAGTLFLALLIAGGSGLLKGDVGETAMAIAAAKCRLTPLEMLIRGALANWLVCLAVICAIAAQDINGKIWGIFFPVMAFVASGFEHSIANMYFIPAALIRQAMGGEMISGLTPLRGVLNILIGTVGNIIGGSLLTALIYHRTFLSRKGEDRS
jgi:formate/nitrite transporter